MFSVFSCRTCSSSRARSRNDNYQVRSLLNGVTIPLNHQIDRLTVYRVFPEYDELLMVTDWSFRKNDNSISRRPIHVYSITPVIVNSVKKDSMTLLRKTRAESFQFVYNINNAFRMFTEI